VVKVIWCKGASPPQTDGSIVFARWHLANTIELVLPSTHPSPQPKRQIDRFIRFCTAHCRKSLYFTMGAPFPLKITSCYGGIWTSSNDDFLGPTEFKSQTTSRSVQHFCTDDRRVFLLQCAAHSPPPSKFAIPNGGCGSLSNTWFLGPTRVLNPSGISIASAVFAGLSGWLVWQTDRLTTILGR